MNKTIQSKLTVTQRCYKIAIGTVTITLKKQLHAYK